MSESLIGGAPTAAPAAAPAASTEPAAAPAAAPIVPDPAVAAPAAAPSPDWLSSFEGIDADVMGDTSLKAIQDIPSLVKSYVHAQRKMGADRVVIPNKNSTPEEWLSVYHKLGMPTEFDAYQVNSGEDSVLKEDLAAQFKKTAFENNLLPEQAQAMFDFLNTSTATEIDRINESNTEASEAKIGELKKEWGEAFDQNVHTAKLAVSEFGGEDLKNYLNETGLGNDPAIIKVFSEIGKKFFKEDSFQGDTKTAYSLSADEAQQRIGELQGDFNGPYYNSMHPDHARTVKEVNKLFQMVG